MKPANFEFARAASLGEAAAMLREANGGAKALPAANRSARC